MYKQGPGSVSKESSAVELVARHEMQIREKEVLCLFVFMTCTIDFDSIIFT
jgi:hypothetical protein